MRPNNNSPVISKKTRMTPKKKVVRKSKNVGMFSDSGRQTGKKQLLTSVANTAPWSVNIPPAGSGTTSSANKKRSAKKPMKTRKVKQKPVKRNGVQNKAPRTRTPNLGNQNSATAWNGME
jgi:hypothetical protein